MLSMIWNSARGHSIFRKSRPRYHSTSRELFFSETPCAISLKRIEACVFDEVGVRFPRFVSGAEGTPDLRKITDVDQPDQQLHTLFSRAFGIGSVPLVCLVAAKLPGMLSDPILLRLKL